MKIFVDDVGILSRDAKEPEFEMNNPHKWEDVPHRDNVMAGVIPGNKAQRCLYCKAQRIITVVDDGHVHVIGTKPPGLSDECDLGQDSS